MLSSTITGSHLSRGFNRLKLIYDAGYGEKIPNLTLTGSSRTVNCPYSTTARTDIWENGLPSVSSNTPPKDSRVVICGGGIMGAAVAHQLAQRGWGQHTVLIERGRIGEGNPWHFSGLLGELKPTHSQVLLAQTSLELIRDLHAKGLPTGWKQTGSLNLARTRDRMTMFRRMKSQSV